MFGIIGLVIIVACWIPLTVEIIKTQGWDVKLSFVVLYFVSSDPLTYELRSPSTL